MKKKICFNNGLKSPHCGFWDFLLSPLGSAIVYLLCTSIIIIILMVFFRM